MGTDGSQTPAIGGEAAEGVLLVIPAHAPQFLAGGEIAEPNDSVSTIKSQHCAVA
jgi:hypothetical protein